MATSTIGRVGPGIGDIARRAVVWRDAHPLGERLLIAAGLAVAWTVSYHVLARIIDAGRAVSLRTPFDAAVPFLPWTIVGYGLCYGAALYPAFVVRSPALLRRIALAYVVVIAASLACFVLFPVTSAGFRPPLSEIDARTLVGWAVRLVYALDPPMNLFPSLHVGLAAIGAAGACRASPRLGAPAVGIVALTIISVCTVKQHYLVDAVAALLLVALVDHALLRGYDPGDGPRAFTWRGVAGYFVLQAGLYGVLTLAFLAGVRV
jgi:membrane-associated phospholipid phosphatase